MSEIRITVGLPSRWLLAIVGLLALCAACSGEPETPAIIQAVETAVDNGMDETEVLLASPCADGVTVPNPEENIGLVRDCVVLLGLGPRLFIEENWANIRGWRPGKLILATGRRNETEREPWRFVTVGREVFPLRVTTIHHLYKTNEGTLPREIADLTGLRHLYFSIAKWSGPIPSEWGRLANLKELTLKGEGITGQIPAELAALPNLEELNLVCTSVEGEVPMGFAELPALEELYLPPTMKQPTAEQTALLRAGGTEFEIIDGVIRDRYCKFDDPRWQ